MNYISNKIYELINITGVCDAASPESRLLLLDCEGRENVAAKTNENLLKIRF
jgi:hypothetical protein